MARTHVNRVVVLALAVCMSGLLVPNEAKGFWFWNKGKNASDAADAASEAGKQYYKSLTDPTATDDDIAAKKAAWDILRNNALQKCIDFGTSVPGTTITGPADLKKISKDLVKEAIKEALKKAGAISDNYSPQFPLGNDTDYIPIKPLFAASQAAQSILVTEPIDYNTAITGSLSVLSASDYDGSEGPAPIGFGLSSDIVVLKGTFSGFILGSNTFYHHNGSSSFFGPAEFNAAILNNSTLATSADLGTRLDSTVYSLIPSADPNAGSFLYIQITSVNTTTGELSGNYLTANFGTEVPEPSSAAILIGCGGLSGIGLRRRIVSQTIKRHAN